MDQFLCVFIMWMTDWPRIKFIGLNGITFVRFINVNDSAVWRYWSVLSIMDADWFIVQPLRALDWHTFKMERWHSTPVSFILKLALVFAGNLTAFFCFYVFCRLIFPHGLPDEYSIVTTIRARRTTKKERWYLWQIFDQSGGSQVSQGASGVDSGMPKYHLGYYESQRSKRRKKMTDAQTT